MRSIRFDQIGQQGVTQNAVVRRPLPSPAPAAVEKPAPQAPTVVPVVPTGK